MFEGFVHPGIVIGTALAAVPLIIHLLNRQRHRPMPWAAMRFVLAAYKKTRRRVQVENLLLLLLRMGAVALLALAVSRPFTGDDSPLAALTESRRDLILVVDGSASTGYRQEVETVFERVVDRARELLRELDGGRGDRARVILAGARPRTLSLSDPDKGLSVLETLTSPTDEALDLAATLAEVVRVVEEDAAAAAGAAGEFELRFLTDLQRRSFGALNEIPELPADDAANALDGSVPAASEPSGLRQSLDRIEELGLALWVEDLGPAEPVPANLGLVAIDVDRRSLASGVPVDVRLTIQNHGARSRAGVRVVLEVNGERRPSQTVDLDARSTTEVTFTVTFRDPGTQVVTGFLEGDRLPVDDSLNQIIDVPPPVQVLLVNGAPGGSLAEIEQDEVGFLLAVLEPAADDGNAGFGARSPFRPRVVLPEEFAGRSFDLAPYDVIWLANVESLPSACVKRLTERVAAGTALIVSLGDRTVPETFNELFFAADGSGLSPAELSSIVQVASRRSDYYRVATFEDEHPVFEFFAEDRWRPLLTEVPVFAFGAARPLPSARVLATLDDDASSPLLVERRYDRGRVLLWTTTIDPGWTRLPESPRTLVPLVHELVRHASSIEGPRRNVQPAEPLIAEVTSFPRLVEFVQPDGTRRPLEGAPQPEGPGRWRLPAASGDWTARAGLYRIEVDGAALPFSVQIDPEEGDLARASSAELEGLHRAMKLVRRDAAAEAEADDRTNRRGELWRQLALACLVFLVLESLWAAWIGQRRRVA